MDAYLWLDGLRTGAANMAVDEAMAAWCGEHRVACLRVYRWSEPTLSLGYFQAAAERLADPRLARLPFTRRLSGGGAIVHDREVTYSLAVPQTDFSKSAAEPLYRSMHAAIAAALQSHGYDARTHAEWSALQGVSASQARDTAEPFLCFERRSPIDLIVDGAKVVGSAQRRLSGVLLQHGSILTGSSESAPQLLGLAELPREPVLERNRLADCSELSDENWVELIIAACQQNFAQSIKPDRLYRSMQTDAVAAIEAEAERLYDCKYRHPDWIERR